MNEYRRINLDEWVLIGGGANSDSYFHKTDDSIMLKLNTKPEDDAIFLDEYKKSEQLKHLSVNTPRAVEMVKAGERLGIIYERIRGKKSIARLCADNPGEIEKYAGIFAFEAKRLHSTPCDKTLFSNHHDFMIELLEKSKLITNKQKKRMLDHIAGLENPGTCIHQDMNPGNLVLDEEGKAYWIDAGALDYGNPIFDIGILFCMCKAMTFYKTLTGLTHMSKAQLSEFWTVFEKEYLGSNDPDIIRDFEYQAAFSCAESILFRMTLHGKAHDSLADKLLYRMLFGVIILPKG